MLALILGNFEFVAPWECALPGCTTSRELFRDVSVGDKCVAASLKSPHTFIWFYCLHVTANYRDDKIGVIHTVYDCEYILC